MTGEALVLTLLAFFIIWLLWPYVPLSEILPSPKPRLPEGGWPGLDEEPPASFRKYYSLLCWIVALPVAFFAALVPGNLVTAVLTAFFALLGVLASVITICQFFDCV